MKEDKELRDLLKRNVEVLTATGIFGAFAIGIQNYIPGILGFCIAAMSILATIIFLASFISDMVNNALDLKLKFILSFILSATIFCILLHLILGISPKPLTGNFYILLSMIFVALESTILSVFLSFSSYLKKKMQTSKVIQITVSIMLIIIPCLLSYLTYKIDDHAINLYAEKYYSSLQ